MLLKLNKNFFIVGSAEVLHFVFKIMRRILNVQKLLEVNLAKNENVIDYEKGELLMCVDETAVDEIISFNIVPSKRSGFFGFTICLE